MADQELKQYPRGQITLGAGETRQTTDFDWDHTNNAKLIHVLRQHAPSGYTVGNIAVAFNGNTVIDEDGPEKDYFDLIESGKAQQVRIKLPGAVTKTIVGVLTSVKGKITLEDGVQIGYSGIGSFVKS